MYGCIVAGIDVLEMTDKENELVSYFDYIQSYSHSTSRRKLELITDEIEKMLLNAKGR